MTQPLPGEGDPLAAYDPQRVSLPDSGNAAREQTALSTAEGHSIERIVVLTLSAVLAVKGLDWLVVSRKWEDGGRFDDPEFRAAITKEFERRLRRPLVPILSGMLLMGRHSLAESLGLEVVAHTTTHAIADAWARHYISKVVADFATTSTEALRPSVADWLTRPLPAAAMAQRARELYGLDPRAAAAVQSYAAKPGKGKDGRGLIERYLEHRARANASVWTMAAHNAGRELLYAQAIEDGLLPAHTRKVWVTAHDERTCPVCAPMDGVSVRIGTRFHVAGSLLTSPPVHPNCRCTIDIDTRPHRARTFVYTSGAIEHWLASATKSLFR